MTGHDLKQIYEAAKATPDLSKATDSRLDRVVDTLKAKGFEAGWERKGFSGVEISLARDGVSKQFYLDRDVIPKISRNLGKFFMDVVCLRQPVSREILSYDNDPKFLLETEKDEEKLAEFLVKQLGYAASLKQQPKLVP